MAFETWTETIRHREVLVFIDNDSAPDALIRGFSSSEASAKLARAFRLRCAGLAAAPWFARVPSPSNLADAPSRGESSLLNATGAKPLQPKARKYFETLELLIL